MASFVRNFLSPIPVDQQWLRYLEGRSSYEKLSEFERSALVSHRDSEETKFAIKQSAALVSSSLVYGICAASDRVDHSISQQTQILENRLFQVQTVFSEGFSSLKNSLDSGITQVDRTLRDGFEEISDQLSDLSDTVTYWSHRMDSTLRLQVQSQRVSNTLSLNIAKLMRIPDIQKERQDNLEKGLTHFKNGILDADFYEYAKEKLEAALAIEKSDYVALYHLGMIHLFTSQFLDLKKAAEYFMKAGKFAAVESNPRAAHLCNILAGDPSKPLEEQSADLEAVKRLAADAYSLASQSYDLQESYEKAIDALDKSISLVHSRESSFMRTRLLCLTGKDDEAVQELETLIKADKMFALQASICPELVVSSAVIKFLTRLRDVAVSELAVIVKQCESCLTVGSEAIKTVKKLRGLLNKASYLDALEGIYLAENSRFNLNGQVLGLLDFLSREFMIITKQRPELITKYMTLSLECIDQREQLTDIIEALKAGDMKVYFNQAQKADYIDASLKMIDTVSCQLTKYKYDSLIYNFLLVMKQSLISEIIALLKEKSVDNFEDVTQKFDWIEAKVQMIDAAACLLAGFEADSSLYNIISSIKKALIIDQDVNKKLVLRVHKIESDEKASFIEITDPTGLKSYIESIQEEIQNNDTETRNTTQTWKQLIVTEESKLAEIRKKAEDLETAISVKSLLGKTFIALGIDKKKTELNGIRDIIRKQEIKVIKIKNKQMYSQRSRLFIETPGWFNGDAIRTFNIDSHHIASGVFSPDGRLVLFGSIDNTLKLWDVASGKEIRTFTGHSSNAYSVAFSPDGQYALSGSLDYTLNLKLWDVSSGQEIRTFIPHLNKKHLNNEAVSNVWSVAFSPDGQLALSGSGDETLKLWDVSSGREIRFFSGHSNCVYSVAFSPDGRLALSGSADYTLKLWDVASGKEIRTFTGHSMAVNSVAFSPDGRLALSGSWDHTFKLWDVASGKEIRTFIGHSSSVDSVAFSPDGRLALSGSLDHIFKLWVIASGRDILTFEGDVYATTFSPDGRLVLLGNRNYVVQLWNVELY